MYAKQLIFVLHDDNDNAEHILRWLHINWRIHSQRLPAYPQVIDLKFRKNPPSFALAGFFVGKARSIAVIISAPTGYCRFVDPCPQIA
jgi:hypothetical protein